MQRFTSKLIIKEISLDEKDDVLEKSIFGLYNPYNYKPKFEQDGSVCSRSLVGDTKIFMKSYLNQKEQSESSKQPKPNNARLRPVFDQILRSIKADKQGDHILPNESNNQIFKPSLNANKNQIQKDIDLSSYSSKRNTQKTKNILEQSSEQFEFHDIIDNKKQMRPKLKPGLDQKFKTSESINSQPYFLKQDYARQEKNLKNFGQNLKNWDQTSQIVSHSVDRQANKSLMHLSHLKHRQKIETAYATSQIQERPIDLNTEQYFQSILRQSKIKQDKKPDKQSQSAYIIEQSGLLRYNHPLKTINMDRMRKPSNLCSQQYQDQQKNECQIVEQNLRSELNRCSYIQYGGLIVEYHEPQMHELQLKGHNVFRRQINQINGQKKEIHGNLGNEEDNNKINQSHFDPDYFKFQ